jgi:hypothetical protein
MMAPQPGEVLVVTASDGRGRQLARYVGGPGATVRSMIARVDASHGACWGAHVRGEFTSDGTRHGIGNGRLLASREPRMIDGAFYSGWIIE